MMTRALALAGGGRARRGVDPPFRVVRSLHEAQGADASRARRRRAGGNQSTRELTEVTQCIRWATMMMMVDDACDDDDDG